MVMKHFDEKLKLNRQLEFEVWRQCNMIGTRGADPFGLSIPLIDAGLEVRLITEWKSIVNAKRWKNQLTRAGFSSIETELCFLGIHLNKQRASESHLTIEYKRPTVSAIVSSINSGYVPLALVHMGVVHSLNVPHWVVITDANDETVMFNDPYPPKGHRGLKLPRDKFQKILDDIGTRIGMSPSLLLVRR
jgi:hypothetical protein